VTQYNWLGGIGNWANAQAWYPGAVPDQGANAVIVGYGVATATARDLSQETVWLNRSGNLPVSLAMQQGALGNLNSVASAGDVNLELNNTPLFGGLSATLGNLAIVIDPVTAAVNYGTMLAQGGIGAASISVNDTLGAFSNVGNLEAGRLGAISVAFAPPVTLAPGQGHQLIGNTGTVTATGGGSVAFNAGHAGGGSFGFVFNQSALVADGGTITINADLLQLPAASTFIRNSGTVVFNDGTSQGTVEIDNGTAQFGLYAPGVPGPVGAICFASTFNLVGDARFNFESTAVTAAFDEATQDLSIFTQTAAPVKLATWQVESSAYGHLTVADFSSLNPTTIAFHHA
jgi:hypothetical protein